MATKVTNTKKKAIDAARDIARNQGSELIIHDKDGKIRSKDSHGRDLFPKRLVTKKGETDTQSAPDPRPYL